MSLDALLASLETPDFEENGKVRLQSASIEGGRVEVILGITQSVPNQPEKLWKIVCTDTIRYSLGERLSGWRDCVDLTQDHPAVWELTNPAITLGIRGKASDPVAVVGALAMRHQRIAGQWIPFGDCLRLDMAPNKTVQAIDILSEGYGFLARGPERLMLAYGEVLKEYGVEPLPSVARNYSARLETHIPVADESVRGLIFGTGYIVGRTFEASPV